MKEKIQKDFPKCPFFKFCGAEVIREHRGENWHQRFCLTDYKKCEHYQNRERKGEERKFFEMKITERVIGRANLTSEEAKVVRCCYQLESAGERTWRWVNHLSPRKHNLFLSRALAKIHKTLRKGARE